MAGHASPGKRDHLWVLAVIAICALLEVWASWLGIGSVSGFPKLGEMTTGWILPVTTEAYWGYAVWAWLASSPGPRSRRFAMWTAIVMFTLSLGGQEAGHLVAAAHRQAPPYVVAFVTALPLIAVGLIAILIHLRQADREEAGQAARVAAVAERLAAAERTEADERGALHRRLAEVTARAGEEISALRKAVSGAEAEREAARSEAEALTARVESLTRKLAGNGTRKPAGSGTRKGTGNTARKPAGSRSGSGAEADAEPGTEVPADLDSEALVLMHLSKGKSASEAGRLAGLSDARGRQIARKLAKTAPQEAAAENP